MFTNAKILATERVNLGTEEGWNVLLEVDNPKFKNEEAKGPFRVKRAQLLHTIPDSALLWRAAEMETDDMDAVLDVVLTENYVKELNPPTVPEHVSRCARVKLNMRLSTRENKSVLRDNAVNRFQESPVTAEQAEEPHPLSSLRSHMREGISREDVDRCREMLRRGNQEMK